MQINFDEKILGSLSQNTRNVVVVLIGVTAAVTATATCLREATVFTKEGLPAIKAVFGDAKGLLNRSGDPREMPADCRVIIVDEESAS